MKAHRKSGGLAPLIHNLGTWWRWVANPTPWPHHTRRKSPGTPVKGSWIGTTAGLDTLEKRKSLAPACIRQRIIQLVV